MEGFKRIVCILVIFSFIGVGVNGYAKPDIPADAIPSDISEEIRRNIEGLYSLDAERRAESALNIGSMGREAFPAMPFLISLFNDKNRDVRANAATALGELNNEKAVKPLINTVLKDNDLRVRRKAAKALERLRHYGTVDYLINAFKDGKFSIRENAVMALGYANDPDAIGTLISAIKERDTTIRKYAVEALGRIDDARTISPLISVLKDKNLGIRKKAIKALGYKPGKSVVRALITTLYDKNTDIKKRALKTLKILTGHDYGLDYNKWQTFLYSMKQSQVKLTAKRVVQTERSKIQSTNTLKSTTETSPIIKKKNNPKKGTKKYGSKYYEYMLRRKNK